MYEALPFLHGIYKALEKTHRDFIRPRRVLGWISASTACLSLHKARKLGSSEHSTKSNEIAENKVKRTNRLVIYALALGLLAF